MPPFHENLSKYERHRPVKFIHLVPKIEGRVLINRYVHDTSVRSFLILPPRIALFRNSASVLEAIRDREEKLLRRNFSCPLRAPESKWKVDPAQKNSQKITLRSCIALVAQGGCIVKHKFRGYGSLFF